MQGTRKCQCFGLLMVLTVVSALVAFGSFSLGEMLTREKTESIFMLTTTKEDIYPLHVHSVENFMVHKICMKVDHGDIEKVLFTSSPKSVNSTPYHHQFNNVITDKETGFFFYFSGESTIDVPKKIGNASVTIKKGNAASVATLCDHCSKNNQLDRNRTYGPGFFCLCITPNTGAVEFDIHIHGNHQTIDEDKRRECNHVEYSSGGAKFKCCNFTFLESVHNGWTTPYLTSAQNTKTSLLTPNKILDSGVEVYVQYHNLVKILTAVMLGIVMLIGFTFILLCCVKIKCRVPDEQH